MSSRDQAAAEAAVTPATHAGAIPAGCPPEARQIMMRRTLRMAPMFARLPEETMGRLVEGCRLVPLEKGAYVFHAGEPAEGFFMVHAGAINVHRVTEDGREQVIRVFYPGECFGEVVLAGGGDYPAAAKAAEGSQLILIPADHFRREIRKDPDLALSLLGSLSLHLRYLVETVESLKLQQAESRVAQWLLRQMASRGQQSGERPESWSLPLAKHLLASQLGLTSETLSRVFARFKREGWIELDGKKVRVHSPEALRQVLDNPADG